MPCLFLHSKHAVTWRYSQNSQLFLFKIQIQNTIYMIKFVPRWKPIRSHPNLAAGPLRACCCYFPLLDEGKRLSWLSPKPAVTSCRLPWRYVYIYARGCRPERFNASGLGLFFLPTEKKKKNKKLRHWETRSKTRPLAVMVGVFLFFFFNKCTKPETQQFSQQSTLIFFPLHRRSV